MMKWVGSTETEMTVKKDYEPERVREDNETVFIVIRTLYFDENREEETIEAVFREKDDAEDYASDEFMNGESGTIIERILR